MKSILLALSAILALNNTYAQSSSEKEKTGVSDPSLFHKATEKFVVVSSIGLEFRDPKQDYQEYSILDSPNIEEKMEEAEEKRLKKDLKAQSKEEPLLNSTTIAKKSSFKIDNTIFTDIINDTLVKYEYLDTNITIYPDNVNTLFLEGNIRGIKEFYVEGTGKNLSYYLLKLELVWYIRNVYGESIDSVTSSVVTDKYETGLKYNYFTDVDLRNCLNKGITKSVFQLFKEDSYQKLSGFVSDFNPSGSAIKLVKPTNTVKTKMDVNESTVTVKTKNGHGSGFSISNDGYIITNFHVVSGEKLDSFPEVKVINHLGEERVAKVVQVNRYNDLALLKVDMAFTKSFVLPGSKNYAVTETVYTTGTPKSVELGQSIAAGVISNERKAKNLELIQLGMPINGGNSGGPLYGESAALNGVIVAKLFGWGTEGIAFAIPAYRIAEYLKINY